MKDIDLRILKALAGNGYELSMFEIQEKLTENPDVWLSPCPSIGTIFVSGDRLEEAGLVQKVHRPGGSETGGRARRFLRLTGDGLAAAKSADQ